MLTFRVWSTLGSLIHERGKMVFYPSKGTKRGNSLDLRVVLIKSVFRMIRRRLDRIFTELEITELPEVSLPTILYQRLVITVM